MKKYFILSIILVAMIGLYSKAINLESEINFGFQYNSNIILLSDDDTDQFLDNEKPDKYQISSLDDMVMNMSYALKMKNYIFSGHTQIDDLKLNFNKYLENSVKDNGYISLGIKQFFSRKLDMSLRYYYYPQIYLRQYKSVLDDEYHEFEYSKNYYTANLKWDIASKLNIQYGVQYTQLFFSKWFTEYDADIITSNISLNWQPAKKVQLQLRYGYRFAEADAEDAFAEPELIDVIKDASYKSNIYYGNLKFKRMPLKTTFNISYQLETRYFDSEYENDTYHFGRNDYIHSLKAGIYKSLHKNLSLILKAEYGFRNTESPVPSVIADKEYSFWKTGITFSYDIILK
jgi:hypothetical protein